jgi:hypothetical protein
MPPKSRRIPVEEENNGQAPPDMSQEERTGEPTGDGGAREAEVTAAQERFDALGETLDLGETRGELVRNATAFVLEMFKHRPRVWDQMSKSEQQDLIKGVEHNCHELVRQIVEAVVAGRTDPVRCLFVGFTDKGDDIKAELKLKAASKEDTERAVLFFHRARGMHVLVDLASASEFHTEPANDESEEDQRPLGFEAGSDEHPEDDSDLAHEGGSDDVDTELIRDGEAVIFALENGRARIDLKRGWVQFLADDEVDHDANWQDMREATPAELAAERDRIADFEEATPQAADA